MKIRGVVFVLPFLIFGSSCSDAIDSREVMKRNILPPPPPHATLFDAACKRLQGLKKSVSFTSFSVLLPFRNWNLPSKWPEEKYIVIVVSNNLPWFQIWITNIKILILLFWTKINLFVAILMVPPNLKKL